MSNLYEWFHDDITWCGNECSNIACERNLCNRLMQGGLYSAAMFKDTEMCPLYKENHIWKEVYGYATPGGDPVWVCPTCGGTMHVHGIESRDEHHTCEKCGLRNYYPWEVMTNADRLALE